ncbi:hypothetical protein F2P79_004383 [Pimephales promelas]|nr:hypothetical protein F2P79_004383 [Pimephales promelas]
MWLTWTLLDQSLDPRDRASEQKFPHPALRRTLWTRQMVFLEDPGGVKTTHHGSSWDKRVCVGRVCVCKRGFLSDAGIVTYTTAERRRRQATFPLTSLGPVDIPHCFYEERGGKTLQRRRAWLDCTVGGEVGSGILPTTFELYYGNQMWRSSVRQRAPSCQPPLHNIIPIVPAHIQPGNK